MDRLGQAAGRLDLPDAFREAAGALLADLGPLRERARHARGPKRDEIAATLPALEQRLVDLTRETATPDLLAAARADAEQDLAGYRGRLAPAHWANAIEAATAQRLRERLGLPTLDL
jgi:hypothetical protein